MIDRYEQFSMSISSIYKTIQKLKREGTAQYGLKGPHVQCLLEMLRHDDGVTLSRLCELCELDKAAISRAISELEEKGMVERGDGADKLYRAPLRLTSAGRGIAQKVSGLVERAVELAGEGLSDADRQIFYRTLDLIAANLRRISREGTLQKNTEGTQEHES